MTTTYNVSVVLEGVELTDATLDRLFSTLPDAVPADIAGLVTVTASIDASDPEAAAFALVDALHRAVPAAVAVRLDQDLVAIPDIAERTERTRESVRLLVEGKRGPGAFPLPVGTVGDGIRVWPWASVLDWFRNAYGVDLGERGIPPEVAAVVDSCLGARRRLTNHTQVAWASASAPGRLRSTPAAVPAPYQVRSAPRALVA